MPKTNSTALPLEEGLLLRRLYFTVGATIQALEYLVNSKDSPKNLACAAECMELCYFQVGYLLDELGIPASWRECAPGDIDSAAAWKRNLERHTK